MAATNGEESRRGRTTVLVFAVVVAGLVLGIFIGLNWTTIRQVASGGGIPAPTASDTGAPPALDPVVTPLATPGTGNLPLQMTYAQVNPDSGAIDASGFVAGIVETDGTCTLTATRGANVVTATSQAMPDAQTTQCGLLSIEAGLLVPGQWTVVINYESGTVHAISDSATLTVP